jgi:hypothetical protein
MLLAFAVCFLIVLPADGAEWTALRTEHFLLLGDASPRAIKDVALRFEQFRAAVTTAFPVLADDRRGPPVVVIVFRDQRAYAPYQPKFNGKTVKVGGYFLGGSDVNYITLATDTGGDDFQSLYHEYTHLLLQRLAGNLSPWFHEGLAEYFSTFDATGNTARNSDARYRTTSVCFGNDRCRCPVFASRISQRHTTKVTGARFSTRSRGCSSSDGSGVCYVAS